MQKCTLVCNTSDRRRRKIKIIKKGRGFWVMYLIAVRFLSGNLLLLLFLLALHFCQLINMTWVFFSMSRKSFLKIKLRHRCALSLWACASFGHSITSMHRENIFFSPGGWGFLRGVAAQQGLRDYIPCAGLRAVSYIAHLEADRCTAV